MTIIKNKKSLKSITTNICFSNFHYTKLFFNAKSFNNFLFVVGTQFVKQLCNDKQQEGCYKQHASI